MRVTERQDQAPEHAGRGERDVAWPGLVGRRSAGRYGDRGSGAAAMVIFAVLFLSIAAFVIDGGMSISQRERAADYAEQAARYAAQDINYQKLRSSQGVVASIVYKNCGARVQSFVRQAGLSGTDVAASHCVRANAQRVEVEVQLTYQPILTGMFYDHSFTVHGRSTAELKTG